MNVAVVTSSNIEEWYKDIYLLVDSLQKIGVKSNIEIWDDPAVNWSSYDAVLIDSTWDYINKYNAYIAWCKNVSKNTKLINNLDIITKTISKKYLLALQSGGINVPTTYIVNNTQEINALPFNNKTRIVVKPIINSDGVNTFLFDSFDELKKSNSVTALLQKTPLVIQHFIPEVLVSGESSVIFIDGKPSHCVLKMPPNNDFRVQKKYGGTLKIAKVPPIATNLYNKSMKVLDVKPIYCRLDFINSPEPCITEIEMIEPEKFFSLKPGSSDLLAKAILNAILSQ